VHLIQDDVVAFIVLYVKQLLCCGIILHVSVCAFISMVASLVSPFMGVTCMLNNTARCIWLTKLTGWLWEAAAQVVEVFLQAGVMSFLGTLTACGAVAILPHGGQHQFMALFSHSVIIVYRFVDRKRLNFEPGVGQEVGASVRFTALSISPQPKC